MYLLVIYLSFISMCITGLFGRFIGINGTFIISVGTMFVLLLISFFIFFEVSLSGSVCSFKLFNWFNNENLYLKWGFLFDSLTSSMLIVIISVSLLVHIFSMNYMYTDPHLNRFMCYLTLFTFFMLVLVTSDNFVQMFLGWEGVGLASYLLINFWYTRIQANKSAIKAILLNRVGDFGLVLGISLIFYFFKSLDYFVVFSISDYFVNNKIYFFSYSINIFTLITIFLFIGAVGKSAQLGLHVWLPDAMEGPTPVSALIHAATMVTAGVFLLIRCSPIIELSSTGLFIISLVGAITAFFAASTGLVQNDLKRVIAYSTCSQLGYMVFACGLSNYSVSFFHLSNHAFFKALLFLSAGAIIHALNDEQDIRKMGGLLKPLPFVYIMILIGSLSLMGFPFLTGFYSKDVILELAFSGYYTSSNFVYWLGLISAFFTAFYSIRLVFFVFYSKTNSYRRYMENLHECSFTMIIPLFLLSIGSIFIGYLSKDLIIGLGSDFWGNTLFYLPNKVNILVAEFIPFKVKILPVIFSLFGTFFALFLYLYLKKFLYNLILLSNNRLLYFIHKFLNKKWYFDIVYNFFITKKFLNFGYNISFKIIDRGFYEYIGPLGIVRSINFISKIFNKIQSGFIFHYVSIILFSIVFIFIFFIFDFVVLQSLLDFDIFLLIILFIFILKSNEYKIINKKKEYLKVLREYKNKFIHDRKNINLIFHLRSLKLRKETFRVVYKSDFFIPVNIPFLYDYTQKNAVESATNVDQCNVINSYGLKLAYNRRRHFLENMKKLKITYKNELFKSVEYFNKIRNEIKVKINKI